MRNPLVVLLLLLGPVAWAVPRTGGHRPEAPLATTDPLSLELPTLPLLQSAVRSLGTPEQDVEAMTREQALLYLFVLHDHDRSGRLDGLELLQLLGTVLAQRDGRWPDPDAVAMLVDRALERQDLSRDGLLDPAELLLLPRQSRPPGQPLQQQLGELLAGTIAVPRVDTEMPRGDAGVSGPGHGLEGGQAATQAEAPNAEGMELEDAPEPEGPDAEAVDAEEAPEIEALEGEAAPAWGDPGEG
ncbi:cell growth regulator with EF hand domain protein 1 [Accipiter gentilis]|uniref:cell growth regulator with EF hand domain protein 1 n=1 Tax=Astur gentilis TaxID=8957 RepID=UPI00210FF353|nr:cell growth regulator with EF hand domain protein 1 [Accipiter gentilis]XP_049674372.1 cell growth regulator with EF hand domain protein 1 [Accipiter gentilis]XP_049674373.1 cell growth regulator with EF hand domain protein 1 [Accipiter gentilis]XP_049674374.1 cell growth regulator with EF hand domain protein 1 [Accipiter gentilis]XP_049674375.1 cell growth regulator with EF hand domain protein 1 [Accipiter gentilis]